jgi:hypothetical protein
MRGTRYRCGVLRTGSTRRFDSRHLSPSVQLAIQLQSPFPHPRRQPSVTPLAPMVLLPASQHKALNRQIGRSSRPAFRRRSRHSESSVLPSQAEFRPPHHVPWNPLCIASLDLRCSGASPCRHLAHRRATSRHRFVARSCLRVHRCHFAVPWPSLMGHCDEFAGRCRKSVRSPRHDRRSLR